MLGVKPDGSGLEGHPWIPATAAPSHSRYLGEPGRPGDGENIQPRVLILCVAVGGSRLSQVWVQLSWSHGQAGLWQHSQGSRMRGSA